ncbi:hypothetical protein ACQP2F_15155 [Actinoplanes sp. CA-030573]|uniref:hypothetical protein n=1 Tax=Actinoplanes sp. CA-030573 TaxID=3239898 RepID=UPI003D93EB61
MTRTWRKETGLALWSFWIRPPAPHGIPTTTTTTRLTTAVTTALHCLPGFAEPSWLEATTHQQGDLLLHPVTIHTATRTLNQLATQHPDLTTIRITCDLLITTTPDQPEHTEPETASLAVIALPASATHSNSRLLLTLRLDIDIYATQTHAQNPNNQTLAAINQPRLTNFLTRLHQHLHTELEDLHAPDYPHNTTTHGFT